MARITEITKPIIRRAGKLMVKIETDGISIKGFRKRGSRGWRKLSFAELAGMALRKHPSMPGYTEVEWSDPLKTIGAK